MILLRRKYKYKLTAYCHTRGKVEKETAKILRESGILSTVRPSWSEKAHSS